MHFPLISFYPFLGVVERERERETERERERETERERDKERERQRERDRERETEREKADCRGEMVWWAGPTFNLPEGQTRFRW